MKELNVCTSTTAKLRASRTTRPSAVIRQVATLVLDRLKSLGNFSSSLTSISGYQAVSFEVFLTLAIRIATL